MKKKSRMFYSLILLFGIAIFFILKHFNSGYVFPKDTGKYVPYLFGTKIDFSQIGNSDVFVHTKDGWGNQEEQYRCTVQKDVFMNLYVPDTKSDLIMTVDAFGSFNLPYTYQSISVYVNDYKLVDWHVSEKYNYSVVIPASIITNNHLNIRFNVHRPYTPKGDIRKLGMVVYQIKIDKIFASHLKKKVSKWLQKHILVGDKPEDF